MSTTESELERTVREEQEAQEAQRAEADESDDDLDDDEPLEDDDELAGGGHVPADPEGNALFDPAAFETEALALPKVDGQGVGKIGLRFGGRVWLDRSSPVDVAMVRDLKMGQTVTLLVEGTVGPPVPGYTTDKEGDLDVLSLTRRLAVTGVYKPVPERLAELQGVQGEAA